MRSKTYPVPALVRPVKKGPFYHIKVPFYHPSIPAGHQNQIHPEDHQPPWHGQKVLVIIRPDPRKPFTGHPREPVFPMHDPGGRRQAVNIDFPRFPLPPTTFSKIINIHSLYPASPAPASSPDPRPRPAPATNPQISHPLMGL